MNKEVVIVKMSEERTLLKWVIVGVTVAIMLFCPTPSLKAHERDSLLLEDVPFIHLVHPEERGELTLLSDDDFLNRAGKVVFRVNRYDEFTDDSLLHRLEQQLFPIINYNGLKLTRLVLRGTASPEGPYANNRRLSHMRAQTLKDFLRARLTVPVEDSVLEVETVAEDYDLLCAMMRRAGDPDLSTVENLVRRHVPRNEFTLMKRRMRQLQGGRLWQRLLRDYFPELRAARLVLYFELPVKPIVMFDREGERIDEVAPDTQTTTEPAVEVVPDTTATEQTEVETDTLLTEVEEEEVRVERRELLSVKTNMLLDVAYMPGYDRWCPIPNVAVEFYPLHGHFTVGASFDCPWWRDYWAYKFFEIRNYQVEGRYYFRSGDIAKNTPGEGAAFRGFYLQAYGHVGLFSICFDANHGWEGEAIGGGVGAGYVLQLGKRGHWRLEFGLQVGYLFSKYDPYKFENPVNPNYVDHLYYYKWTGKASMFRERQHHFSWIGPTRIGVTVSYDLLYRRQARKGVGFRHWEKRR